MFVLFLLYRIVFFTWRHFFFLFFIICILLVLHVGNIYLVIYFRCWMPLGTCLMSKEIQFKSIRCSLRFLFAEVILYALIVFYCGQLLLLYFSKILLNSNPISKSFMLFHGVSASSLVQFCQFILSIITGCSHSRCTFL